ncbi:heparinase [Alteriqipengyuania lutimaris]|uniref:Heparinase n=2 Tax=Alteriqipengyuania lutimaris TaxID=1538146 RepID=A0A395LNA4_9SPHN|nr:heparinase [Alteriqipengyuania lutimaris]
MGDVSERPEQDRAGLDRLGLDREERAARQLIMTLGDKPEPTALSARETEDERVASPASAAKSPDEDSSAAPAPVDRVEVLPPARALVPQEIGAPRVGPGERLVRIAYAAGVRGRLITSPFSKPDKRRILSTVNPPLVGDRAAGMALRAGHFLVHGIKLPIAQLDFGPGHRMAPALERTIHGYSWLRDLAGSGARPQVEATALRIHRMWLDAHPLPGKGPAWEIEVVAHRMLAWLVHAPLLLSNKAVRGRTLAALDKTAGWLDGQVTKAPDRQAEVFGWGALIAAGLLLPEGKPRRLFAEAGLARALGDFVGEDGGVQSRSPLAQIELIELLTELAACYRSVKVEPPKFIGAVSELITPPLLAVMHGEGGMGNWQGAGAVCAERIEELIRVSGVRARPLKEPRGWGYHRASAAKTVLQFDAAPPPLAKYARSGCASTLAFELSAKGQRIIVNCGGAAWAGGQVPARIEQGLRATAAHSTLVLEDVNSTAILVKGKLGAGVTEVEVDRRTVGGKRGGATRIEASHDGYASRFGLLHRRVLVLREDGTELAGEDVLLPASKRGKRGKVGYAIRFHLGMGIAARLSEDRKGAGLALPDGSHWQFRVAGEYTGTLSIEESLFVDGQGRPQPIQQLVLQGMTPRSGGSFAWLFKKMG